MNIDKATFLVLTTAIAAAGCSVTTTNNPADASAPSTPATGGDAGKGDSSTTTPGDGATTPTGDGATPTCPSDEGIVIDCTKETAGCAPAFCAGATKYKPSAARAILDCEKGLTVASCAEGMFAPDYVACANTGAAQACADPGAADACKQVMATCGTSDAGVTQDSCEKFVNALTAEGRTTYVSCMVESSACMHSECL